MNNENDEENIKLFFIEKISQENNDTKITRKIFEEYVKCKNAVNISIHNNKISKSAITKKQEKNINNYNNIKYWIKKILISLEPKNNLTTKKSYSYVNVKSKQIPKPLGDLNFPLLYSSKNIKTNKKNKVYSITNNIFNQTNFGRIGKLEEDEEERNNEEYTDEIVIIKLKQFYDKDQNSLLNILQMGPPDSFRLITWNIVNNICYFNNDLNLILNNINYNANDIYKKFLMKELEKNKSDLIYRDIKRTFPLHNYSSVNKNKKQTHENSLYNVLKAFWNIDDEIGYCQGMNYITGFLLMITDFNEKNTFFLLISIFSNTFIKRKKNNFSFRGLYFEEFPLLYFFIFIFDDLLSIYIPKLKKHLLDNDITNDVWIIKWFQTIFTVILPFNWSKKLWDNIFATDFSFIIKFSISLCLSLEKELIQLNEQQLIMDYFRNIQTVPMAYNNPFLENKFDIDNLLNEARKINIDIDEYLLKYESENEKGKNFKEKIYKINNIKYFDIFYDMNIKKTNTMIKGGDNLRSTNNNIFSNINDISGCTKKESSKILKIAKHSFGSKSNSSDINNIKLNNNKRLYPKYKLIKKTDNLVLNKYELNKKLIAKNKMSNSNIHNSMTNKNNESMKTKTQSSRIINKLKNKGLSTSSNDKKKEKYILQNKTLNYCKLVSSSNLNYDSMNTMINKNNGQKILFSRKKNLGVVPKRNGFSSTYVKSMNNKNSSNKTDISDLFSSSKKNLSKEMRNNNNSKENEKIKTKNTFKNKIMSISILNGNKSNIDNSSRNNLVNELNRRKQYLNKQIKYFSTNDSSKVSNCSFIHTEKKKLINSNSSSNNNFRENDNSHKKNNNNDTKPIKHIKIKI